METGLFIVSIAKISNEPLLPVCRLNDYFKHFNITYTNVHHVCEYKIIVYIVMLSIYNCELINQSWVGKA